MPFIEEIEQRNQSSSNFSEDHIVLFNTVETLKTEVEKLLNKGISPSSFNDLMILKNCYQSALTAIVKLSKKGE